MSRMMKSPGPHPGGGRGPGGPGRGRMGPGPVRGPMGPGPRRRPMGPPPPRPPRRRGCYVATAAYGSYDCPQVWTLRRYRDDYLAHSPAGRLFIRCYYALSPTFVKLFGKSPAVMSFSRKLLDRKVGHLNRQGYADTPYEDPDWQ